MNVFIGFEISIELNNKFINFKEENKQPGLQFIKKETQHITLFYIGKIFPDKLDKLVSKLSKICDNTPPFDIVTDRIDFSPGKTPYMFWLYFKYSEEFETLNKNCVKYLKSVSPGIKNTIPHITIARFKKPHNHIKLQVKAQEKITLHLNKLILWQSSADEKSNKYIKLNEFEFKG